MKVPLLPLVSVVMPVRNEAGFIARSLGSVLAQEYPADRMQVIVADGMSDDGTREIVSSLANAHPKLQLLDNPGRIVATGLNGAIRHARGEIVVRVDGHTEIESDYVQECVSALQGSGAAGVGGRMNAVGEGPFGESVALATSSLFGVGGARFHYSDREEWVDTVYLGAWRRDLFDQVGFFDEELVRNQDDEFSYRVRSFGGRIRLVPSIRSHYQNRATPASLWRQYFQYGYWKVRVLQKHFSQMQPRQFVPGLFVTALLALVLAAPFLPAARWILALLVGTYAIANLVASAIVARGRLRLLPRVFLAFVILHMAYGCGFLAGLARFRNAWGKRRARRGPMAADANGSLPAEEVSAPTPATLTNEGNR